VWCDERARAEPDDADKAGSDLERLRSGLIKTMPTSSAAEQRRDVD
jgi:hypothetical protein